MDEKNNSTGQKNSESKSFVQKAWSSIREVVEFAIIALIIIVPLRMYVAQPFIVNGESMDPTFKDRDYLIVDELSYRFEKPSRGDVIILKYEYGYETSKPYFIKRIVGLPGETVLINGNVTTIKNNARPEGFVLNEPYIIEKNYPNQQLTIALSEKEYFVMGDNRSHSKDARTWSRTGGAEALKEEDIIGRPIFRLFPISKLSLFPGKFEEYSE